MSVGAGPYWQPEVHQSRCADTPPIGDRRRQGQGAVVLRGLAVAGSESGELVVGAGVGSGGRVVVGGGCVVVGTLVGAGAVVVSPPLLPGSV